MKLWFTLFASLFLFRFIEAQIVPIPKKILKYELGITPATLNTFYPNDYKNTSNVLDRPAYEFVNGLFFRYTKNRWAFRVLASYSQNSASITSIQLDSLKHDIQNRDIRIGIGGQYYFFKHWFYAFVDATYRNVFSTGNNMGGYANVQEKFSQTANGIDSYGGLGFRITLFKVVCISPEISTLLTTKLSNTTTTDLKTWNTFESSNFDLNSQFVTKLHLTVKF